MRMMVWRFLKVHEEEGADGSLRHPHCYKHYFPPHHRRPGIMPKMTYAPYCHGSGSILKVPMMVLWTRTILIMASQLHPLPRILLIWCYRREREESVYGLLHYLQPRRHMVPIPPTIYHRILHHCPVFHQYPRPQRSTLRMTPFVSNYVKMWTHSMTKSANLQLQNVRKTSFQKLSCPSPRQSLRKQKQGMVKEIH